MTAVLDVLRTADGERLAASLLPGPGSTCVVLAHGFSGSWAKPAVRRIATDAEIVAAAGESAELWLEEGFAHAEAGASQELVGRLGAHLPVLLGRCA